MTVFADTGFYVALLNPRDRLHQTARTISQLYNGEVLTTEYVLIELGNFLSGFGRKGFLSFHDELGRDEKTEMVPSSTGLFGPAMDLYRSRMDKIWSLTDFSSFSVMQDRGVTEALTFDHHFEQAGFHRFTGAE